MIRLTRLNGWLTRLVLTGLSLLILPLCFLPARADYIIDPLRLELSMPPNGNVASSAVTVSNTGNEAIRLKAYMANWTLDNGGGLIVSDDPNPNALAQHVRFNPKEFELGAKQSQVIRVAAMLPKDVPDGEYRGMLFFEDLKTASQRIQLQKGYGASVQIKQRLGIAVYAYKGQNQPVPALSQFNCQVENGKLIGNIAIENSGSKHLRLAGTILILEADGAVGFKPHREIPINDFHDIVILPSGRRVIQQILSQPSDKTALNPGNYLVELRLSPNEDGKQQAPIVSSVTLTWPEPTHPEQTGIKVQESQLDTSAKPE